MDTITQGILGAVTANLGFRQKLGAGATWMAAAVAVAPDLDILVQPILHLAGAETDTFTRLTYHRALSHSLPLIPLYALIPAALWYRFRKWRDNSLPAPFLLMYATVLVALLSHPLLDWCTSYGTQLLAPFTRQRFALDVLPIIDVFYTPLLILTLLACWLLRLLKRPEKSTLRAAWIGFSLSLAYVALGALNHHLATRYLRNALDDQPPAASYYAYPQVGSVFLWRAVRHHEDQWTTARVNVLFPDRAPARIEHARSDENTWTRRAREIDQVALFTWFAMGQVRCQYHRETHAHVVDVHDMRYGRSPASLESMWPVRVRFSESGRLESVERLQHFGQRSASQTAARAWKAIWQP